MKEKKTTLNLYMSKEDKHYIKKNAIDEDITVSKYLVKCSEFYENNKENK